MLKSDPNTAQKSEQLKEARAILAQEEASNPAVTARVTKLIEALEDKDISVRKDAASALGRIGPESKDAVPVLIEALKDKDVDVRYSAVFALGRIGPAAKDAAPALSEALKDPEARVSGAAKRALKSINK